jgi:hypothetical protein
MIVMAIVDLPRKRHVDRLSAPMITGRDASSDITELDHRSHRIR